MSIVSGEIRISVWVFQKTELKTQPVYVGTVLRDVLPRRRCEEEKKQRGRGVSSYEDVLLS